ncbi:MAG: hemin uptake protein HemP [Gammaproteobacteria bacterium]|nr:hemin uptake protein HemP [Gammaproteobacteria bacterium]
MANETNGDHSTTRQPLCEKELEKRYQSRSLFCGKQEIIIEHAGYSYRLRITRQNKLILTK